MVIYSFLAGTTKNQYMKTNPNTVSGASPFQVDTTLAVRRLTPRNNFAAQFAHMHLVVDFAQEPQKAASIPIAHSTTSKMPFKETAPGRVVEDMMRRRGSSRFAW